MIKRVHFVNAQQDNPNGGVAHSFRTVETKSFFRPKMIDVIDEALREMSKDTGLPFDNWCVDSFSKVV